MRKFRMYKSGCICTRAGHQFGERRAARAAFVSRVLYSCSKLKTATCISARPTDFGGCHMSPQAQQIERDRRMLRRAVLDEGVICSADGMLLSPSPSHSG
eukprot:IDg569t1